MRSPRAFWAVLAAFALAGCGGGGGNGGDGGTPVVAPTITDNPDSTSVAVGGTASFSVAATGDGLTYRWHHVTASSADLTLEETDSTLTLTSATTDDRGGYYVVVTNSGGTATSTTATLTVSTASGNGDVTVD